MTSPFDWLKAIQLKPRFLFGLWILGGLVLGLPSIFADGLGISQVRDAYRPWIGIGTLAAFAFWLVQLVPAWSQRRQGKRNREAALESLNALSAEENILLAYCLANNQQTICLEITNPAALALCQKGIFAPKHGTTNMLASPFTMPSFVWDEINVRQLEFLPDPIPEDMNHALQNLDGHIHRHDGW